MSYAESLREIGKRLQQAVAARRLAKADGIVREYRRCLEALPADAPERARILRASSELFENVRRMTLAARAADAARLTALPVTRAARYSGAEERTRPTWEVSG